MRLLCCEPVCSNFDHSEIVVTLASNGPSFNTGLINWPAHQLRHQTAIHVFVDVVLCMRTRNGVLIKVSCPKRAHMIRPTQCALNRSRLLYCFWSQSPYCVWRSAYSASVWHIACDVVHANKPRDDGSSCCPVLWESRIGVVKILERHARHPSRVWLVNFISVNWARAQDEADPCDWVNHLITPCDQWKVKGVTTPLSAPLTTKWDLCVPCP